MVIQMGFAQTASVGRNLAMEYIRRLDSTEVLRQRRLGNTDVGPHEDERLRVYCEQNSMCSENRYGRLSAAVSPRVASPSQQQIISRTCFRNT